MLGNKADRIRQRREAQGRRAERLAGFWLLMKGYRVVDRRARTPHGEIDIVAMRGPILAFIEVKARANRNLAIEAVTPPNRARIERAARLWAAQHLRSDSMNWRFDIIAVTPGQLPHHLRDAWRPERD